MSREYHFMLKQLNLSQIKIKSISNYLGCEAMVENILIFGENHSEYSLRLSSKMRIFSTSVSHPRKLQLYTTNYYLYIEVNETFPIMVLLQLGKAPVQLKSFFWLKKTNQRCPPTVWDFQILAIARIFLSLPFSLSLWEIYIILLLRLNSENGKRFV